MSNSVKKWGVVAGMAALAAAVLFAGGIVGGLLTGVIPVQAQDDPAYGPGFRMWHGHDGGMGWWGPGRGWAGQGDVLDTAADVLGMTPDALRSELQAGKSLAELAEEKGVDTQTIVDAVHSETEERLQEAVESGRLTQDQADEVLEHKADCDGERLLGMPFGPHMRGGFGRGWGGLDVAAEVLGMEPEDLMAELRDGKTLTEIAEERGVDPQAVEDAMTEQMEQMLQQAEADGTLSPECAECARERFGDCEDNWQQGAGGFFGMRGGMGRNGG